MIASFNLPAHWRRPLLYWGLALVVLLGLYRETIGQMAALWSSSETYAHGYGVPVVSLWLVWRLRHTLAGMVPRAAWLAWVLMLGPALLWLAGDLVAVNAATQLAVVSLVVLSVPALLGWQVAWALVFPLGFLFFAVPIGDFLLPRLMSSTADFTVLALRASGIPVYREGLQFVIPSGMWSVVEACSGIRYLIASVTVGALFAYLNYNGWRKRTLFMGVAIAVPLVANWLRAYLIVMLGHYSGNTLATGVDHLIYGWVFFGVVILAMFMIGARWADPLPGSGSAAVPVGNADGRHLGRLGASKQAPLWGLVVTVVVLCLPLAAGNAMQRLVRQGALQVQVLEPVAPWRADAAASGGAVAGVWKPRYQNPAAVSHTVYTQAGPSPAAWVGLYVHHYRQQGYDRKLVSSTNSLVHTEKDDWVQQAAGMVTAPLAGRSLAVPAAVLREQGGSLMNQAPRLRVWRFYWVNGRYVASDVVAKLQGAWGMVQGHGDDGAIITLYTPVQMGDNGPDTAAADAVLAGFLQVQAAALDHALVATHQGH